MARSKHIVWIVLLLIGVITGVNVGCTNNGCTDNRSSLLLAGLYSAPSGNTVNPVSITIDSLEIGGVGAPDDSLLVTVSQRVSQLYMPLRSRDNSTAFYIHYCQKTLDYPELNDTIAFTYDSEVYFASQECGAIYRYRIKTMNYTRHLVDSVALLDSMINNANIERLKIMFRTASEDDSRSKIVAL